MVAINVGADEMKRFATEAMRKFEETLTGLQIRAMFPTEGEAPTIQRDRQRCERAMEALAAVWTYKPQNLTKLRALTARALELFSKGEFDAGASAVKEVDEFLFDVRRTGASRD
ncbi:hypothetical protein [Variovorax sp. LjRoot178]|uniref:hypothetical protein n=1 Tax=Variovorax sp. LjRoot178 TaxID=3342277 RepID=UPI003F5181C1